MEDYDDSVNLGYDDYADGQWGEEDRWQIPPVQRESLSSLYKNCIKPVAFGPETSSQLVELIAACLLCRLICQLRFIRVELKVFATGSIGAILVWHQIGLNFLPVVMLIILAYPVLHWLFTRELKHSGLTVSCMCLACYLMLELVIVSAETFLKLRGCLMITTMKLISLAWDLDCDELNSMPNVLQYAAYFLSPSSVIFGPWLSYSDHINLYRTESVITNFKRIGKGLIIGFFGTLAMIYSSCISSWIFLEHYHRWILFFGIAQSFRFSHYFVSYFSEATVLLAGSSMGENEKPDRGSSVTEMSVVEFPRSLVEVVSSWNIPMHRWLRKYVFRTTFRHYNSAAFAVFATYFTSSLLHGLNFQLSAVLLSLGFFTYIEHEMREKFAAAFNACVRSRPCFPGCSHAKTKFDPLSMFLNLIFSGLAIFNLIYLGLVFDVEDQQAHVQGYSMHHTIQKWRSVGFVSHILHLGLLVFTKSI